MTATEPAPAPSTGREAYAAGVFTFATFLTPALLAPGPYELANVAGVALALWLAIDVWRQYGREDLGATFPYRVGPVGPGVVGAAALLFLIVVFNGWAAWTGSTTTRLAALDELLRDWWAFPFSPVAMYATPAEGLPTPPAHMVRAVSLSLTAALSLGAVFAFLVFIGGVDRRETLRRHALIWRGVRLEDAEERLVSRGVRGLKPVRDPFGEAEKRPVAGRLYLRAFSLVIAVVCLPYGPVFVRILEGSRIPQVDAFFASPFLANPFFSLWFTGLWAICIAGAVIFLAAYIRLAVALRRP